MILLIGKENCSRCEMVKNILNNKEISYTYKIFNELSQEDREKYMNMARQNNQLSFPIIIKDNKVVDIKEAI